MTMNRRQYLTSGLLGTTTLLAGCNSGTLDGGDSDSGTDTSTPTATSTPQPTATATNGGSAPSDAVYSVGNKERLVPTIEMFPDGWQRDDSVNEDFDAVFLSSDRQIGVLFSIGISESVEIAKSKYDQLVERYDENSFTLADEAFWAERPQNATVIFRHSNAIGIVLATKSVSGESNPDISRAQKYGQLLYQKWRRLT